MHRRSALSCAASGRVLVVMLMLFAWLVISNHCALAALAISPTAHSCCAKEGPAKPAQPELPCCKVLKAVDAGSTAFQLAPSTTAATLDYLSHRSPSPQPFAPVAANFPTGPPRVDAPSVLERPGTQRSQAPPLS